MFFFGKLDMNYINGSYIDVSVCNSYGSMVIVII